MIRSLRPSGSTVAALWPERVKRPVSCGKGYNTQDIPSAGKHMAPKHEARLCHVCYLSTQRGRAGLTENRRALRRQIWLLRSPNWHIDDVNYNRSAVSFDNPDFVEVVLHSYRHCLGQNPGDPSLNEFECRLCTQPDICVPSIMLLGNVDRLLPLARKILTARILLDNMNAKPSAASSA